MYVPMGGTAWRAFCVLFDRFLRTGLGLCGVVWGGVANNCLFQMLHLLVATLQHAYQCDATLMIGCGWSGDGWGTVRWGG